MFDKDIVWKKRKKIHATEENKVRTNYKRDMYFYALDFIYFLMISWMWINEFCHTSDYKYLWKRKWN